MRWSDIGKTVETIAGDAAPLIGTLLGGPAGGAVGSMIASALGTGDDPDQVDAALKADPEALAKIRAAELDNQAQLRQLAVTAEQNRLAADTQRIAAVNQTMVAEVSHGRGGWRDFWGYAAGLSFVAQVGGIVYVIVADPANAPALIGSMGNLSMLWSVPLAVLGVSAWHQGMQGRLSAGKGTASAGAGGLVGAIAKAVTKPEVNNR